MVIFFDRLKKICTLIAIGLIPFYFFRLNHGIIRTNPFEIAVMIAFVAVLLAAYSDRKKLVFGPVWIYLIIVSLVPAFLLASDKAEALGIMKGWFIIPVMLFFCIINSFTAKEMPKISIALYVSLMIVSLWAILQRFGVVGLLFYQSNSSLAQYLVPSNFRILGPFESPNYLAMFIAPLLFLASPIYEMARRKIGKVVILILLFMPLVALYFSQSKGGIIAMTVSALIVLFFYIVRRTRSVGQKVGLLLGLVLIIGVILFAVAAKIDLSSGSNQIREQIYRYAWQLGRENFLWGIGLGNFVEKIDLISKGNIAFREWGIFYALHPHNLFLALWLNLGLLGLVSFLALIVTSLVKAVRSKSGYTIFAIGTLTAILVHGLFDTTYFKNDLSVIFWLAIACIYLSNAKGEDVKDHR